MAVPAPDLAALRLLGQRVRPLAAAAERLLPVPEAIAPLLPHRGIPRGSTVATAGVAATALALALAGPTTAGGAWTAVVGVADLGLLAAAELGVALERTLLVDDPGPQAWAGAVASLLDAVDLVLVRPHHAIAPGVQRRLLAKARDRGSVLLHVGGRPSVWAERPDLVVRTAAARWEGLEPGHGHLRARRLTVAVEGRRGADRPRRAELWLPGPDGRLALASGPAEADPAPTAAPAAPALRVAG